MSAETKSALSDHQCLVNLWRGRLVEAKKTYNQIVGELQTGSTSFTAGTQPTPDESTRFVVKAETQAFDEYMRILRIFTDLVISGKKPEEGPTA